MTNLHPRIQGLIDDFTKQLMTVSRSIMLEAVEQSLQVNLPKRQLRAAPERKLLPPARMRRRSLLSAKPEPKALPSVSTDTKERVALSLVSTPRATVKELAKILGMPLTTTRLTLRHLEQAGTVKVTKEGLTHFYETV